jgi:hypothetical protein
LNSLNQNNNPRKKPWNEKCRGKYVIGKTSVDFD